MPLGGSRADRCPVGKVYNSANKLFALSRVEPVAVMVYGGGSFEGIPWEMIVKEHRRELSTGSFDTIEEYAQEFIRYLSSLLRSLRRVTGWCGSSATTIRSGVEPTVLRAGPEAVNRSRTGGTR